MALDIRQGDILVVGSAEYPVLAVGQYESHGFGLSPGFVLMASVSCSTKRSPDVASGLQGVPATKLSGITCTPLDPVNPRLQQSEAVNTPYIVRETYISDGTDYVRIEVGERKR